MVAMRAHGGVIANQRGASVGLGVLGNGLELRTDDPRAAEPLACSVTETARGSRRRPR